MFKVGDTVVYKFQGNVKRTVIAAYNDGRMDLLAPDGSTINFVWYRNYDLVLSVEDEAKQLLEAAGYTITPPKPKLAGQVVIYKFNGHLGLSSKESYDNFYNSQKDARKPLAIVDWTEGQGL